MEKRNAIKWKIGLLAAFLISLSSSLFVYHYILKSREPFFWDEAHHARYGLIIASAVKSGNWQLFRDFTNGQLNPWPFLHSWVVAGGLLLFGPTFIGARLSSLILFFLSVPLIYLIATKISGEKSVWIGIIAVLFYASSPFILFYSATCMIELLALFLTLLITYLYLQAQETESTICYLLTGVFAGALFLAKYQFGVITVLALLIDGIWRCLDSGKRQVKPYIILFTAFGLIIGFWLIIYLPAVKIKILLYLIKDTGWSITRELPVLDRRLFYIRSILDYYCASIWIFIFIVPGFVYSVWKLWRSHFRFVFIYPAVNLFLISISQNKQDRYIILAVPFLFILGAFFLVNARRWLKRKTSRWIYTILIFIAFIGDIYKIPKIYRQIYIADGRVCWVGNKIGRSSFFRLLKLPAILQQPQELLNPEADYDLPEQNMQDVWEYIYSVVDRKGPLCSLSYMQKFSPHLLRWYGITYGSPVFAYYGLPVSKFWDPRCVYFASLTIDPVSIYYTAEGKRMTEGRNMEWNLFLTDLEKKGLIELIDQKKFTDIKVTIKIYQRCAGR